ncbi:MAG: alkaline phosphatase family protein [Polyangiaceae bacterium]
MELGFQLGSSLPQSSARRSLRMPAALEHVFVLMLENRSFDHLFGFSGLSGIDAATGAPTAVDGLRGNESNTLAGKSYPVVRGGRRSMDSRSGTEPSLRP